MWKKILIGLGIAALIGGFVGYKMWTKPHESITAKSADFTFDAATFVATFDSAKHTNKTIEIAGKIVEVVNLPDSPIVLTLEGSGDITLNCPLDPFTQQKTNFEVGQNVKLKGIFLAKDLLDYKFDRCVVVP